MIITAFPSWGFMICTGSEQVATGTVAFCLLFFPLPFLLGGPLLRRLMPLKQTLDSWV